MNLDRAQRGRRSLFASAAMVAMLLTASVAVGQPACAQEATAALPGNDFTPGSRSSLPEPLEQIDADRYRQIFKLQAAGDYRGADALIADLTDQSLLGHVLADRYLSRAYKTSPKELSDWLKQYAGQPDAERRPTEVAALSSRVPLANRLPLNLRPRDGQLDAGEQSARVGRQVGLTIGGHQCEVAAVGRVDPVLELPGLPC